MLRFVRYFFIISFILPVSLWSNSCSTVLGSLFSYTKFDLYSLDKGQMKRVGSGELLSPLRNNRVLEFQYQSDTAVISASGRVKLEWLNNCKFRLNVSGIPSQSERQEIVNADSLLAQYGMLHFYFDRKMRFFQIRNKSGETKMVTEYGLLIFKPVSKSN